MPLDSGNSYSGRFSGFADDLGAGGGGGYYAKDAFRERLHGLFAQIEKEFDTLYMENLNLQEKLEGVATGNNAMGGGVPIGSGGGGICGVGGRIFNMENVENSTAGGGDLPGSASKNFKFGATAGVALAMGSSTPNMSTPSAVGGSSSKVKASHKLKAQTSRIVSSFKQQSVVCSVVREFNGHKDGVWQVAAKSGQPIIGTASADRTACIFSIDSGRCLLQYTGHEGSVNSLKFHPNRDLVLTSSGDMTAHIWQAAVNWDTPSSRKGHSSEEELEEEAAEDPMDEREKVDVLRTPIAEFNAAGGQGHAAVVSCADWLPGGEQIITASWDRTAILWDVETREPLVPLTGHDRELTYCAAHPTMRLVVTSSSDSTFRLWDFRDQIPAVSVFQGHSESVTSTVFARDDKVVSGSDDRTVKVWELRNMRSALATIRTDSSVNRLAISPTGIIGIPHDNRHIRLFDLNGQRVARLPRSTRLGHRRMVSSLAWSDDPYTNLFSCGFDRRVLGWNVCLPRENL